MKTNAAVGAVAGIGCLAGAGYIAFWCCVGYVIYHFVSKLW